LVKDTGKRGAQARSKFYKKVKNISEEQAIENFKEKQRRLAEKMGWNDTWLKDAKNRRNIKNHKSRVKHSGHGK